MLGHRLRPDLSRPDPFLEPKPDLKDQTDFVFVAGLALVYVAFSAFKAGLD